ncbi:hypothetical protein HF521_017566 [Silurus meridionalis]|uniref:Mucin-1 n=1 Tax=Silurus meridionalis TaxID=175797 RepID=A0A8T0BN19_SILME|nr:hypothetical protein HF521_017566 [Silurus meridionalis]
MCFYWIIGLLVLWSGVITASNVTAAPGVGTTTSNETSAFNMSIKITNRTYNKSLEDTDSHYYKTLRQDVEDLFSEVYKSTSSAGYQKITDMTFSEGSVIANSTVIFQTNQTSGQYVKITFIDNYKKLHSPLLTLNINYTADQEPHFVLLNMSHPISTTTEFSTSPNPIQHLVSSTLASTTNRLDLVTDSNDTITTPQSHSTSFNSVSASQTTPNITSNNSSITLSPRTVTSTMTAFNHSFIPNSTNSSSGPSNITVDESPSVMLTSSPSTTTLHPSSISTISASSSSTRTNHPSSISTISASSSSTRTNHPSSISTISASSSSTRTNHPSSISTISASSSSSRTKNPGSISGTTASSSSTTTVHETSNISATPALSSSVNPGKTVTQKPTEPAESNTVATEQGVPGWGIAILVLAAIILFFMLILLILLLLFWCCWWRQRGFMKVSDPDPTGYYNPDIPMYSTHSTYESHNGKSLQLPQT